MSNRTCTCDRGIPATGPVPAWDAAAHCNKCYLFATNETYNRNHGGDGTVRPVAAKPAPVKTSKVRAASRKPLPTYPCVHRGERTGERTECGSCGGGVMLPVQACAVHGRCVVAKTPKDATIQCCAKCKQREEPTNVSVGATLDNDNDGAGTQRELVPLGLPQHHKRRDHLNRNDDREDAIRSTRLREQVASLPDYPDPRPHHGRGIVTVAGGAKYFTCAFVMLSLLRRHGCELPVEVWHLDEGEMDERMRALLEGFGNVRLVDASAVRRNLPEAERPRNHTHDHPGWECKTFAIQHSAFREVLFLDADQLPARDPSYLFDDPNFREHGAVFWPDFEPEGWRVTARAFRICGLPVPGKTRAKLLPGGWHNPTDYEAWETGQVLLDKSRHWPALKLWQHFGDDAAFWYAGCITGKGADLVYGDKDTAYLSWHMLGLPFAMPRKSDFIGRVNVSGAFVQYDFDGDVAFYHRVQPQTKFNLHGDNPPIPGCTVWPWVEEALATLKAQWSGRPFDSYGEPPGANVSGIVGEWWLCNGETKPIKLRQDRIASGVAGITHWTARRDHRGDLLVLSNGAKAVHFLGRDPHGNWINHGEETFLVPAPPKGISLPMTRHDAVVAHSVLRLNEYRMPDQFAPGAVVLDIGAHCGLSVRAALDRGAAHVVAVEPAPGNLEYLRRNFGTDGRVTILPVAAWTRSGTVTLSPGAVKCGAADSSAGWTVHDGGSLQVPCLPLADLVETARAKSNAGRIAMLKLDVEGAEWSLFLGADLGCVDAVSIEYHGSHRDEADTPERLAAMLGPEFACAILPHPEAARLGIITATRTSP